MKSRLLQLFIRILFKILNKKEILLFLKLLILKADVNLLLMAYRSIGIHIASDELSGEKKFIQFVLKNYLPHKENYIFFDVGANIGNYSIELANNFEKASIFAFEPTIETTNALNNNTKYLTNIKIINKAVGDKNEKKIIYKSKDNAHNTLYKEVLEKLLIKDSIEEEVIEIITIDDFCKMNSIKTIDFLKIDTEGNEFFVLKGAKNMLENNRIKVIQFEFNEMNIISRVFLKDFYDILPNFDFYRLNTSSLVPLGKYNSFNEIFQFQNIIAINICDKTLRN
jgi:FkbM family methyltransferase